MSRLQYAFIALASAALFVFANIRNPLINDDGVLYLLLAERIGSEGLAPVFSVFDRPLYSWLIAALHALSGLSLRYCAYILDGALVWLLVFCFIEFCRLLYRDDRILPWAALLVLLHPRLNNYFAFVIRDLGYWAWLLASFCLLLRDIATPRARYLAGWMLCTLLAAAFKPEALVFGVLPLALLAAPARSLGSRWKRVASAGVALSAALALLALLGVARAPALPDALRDLPALPGRLLQEIPAAFSAASERYASAVLDPYSRDVAALSLASGLLGILFAKFFNALGIAQLFLIGHGLRRSALGLPGGNRAAYALMIACALLLPALFLAYRQFLDGRYVMLLCLLALAPAARSLQLLAQRSVERGHSGRFALILLLVLGTDFVLGLNKQKPYLLACVEWMRTEIPDDARVFGNDRQLLGQTGLAVDLQEVQGAAQLIAERRAPLAHVAFWIIHIRPGQRGLADSLLEYEDFLVPVQRFESERGDLIMIYAPVDPGAG